MTGAAFYCESQYREVDGEDPECAKQLRQEGTQKNFVWEYMICIFSPVNCPISL